LPPGDPERLRLLADSCEALLATGRAEDIELLTAQAIDEAGSKHEPCIEARLRVWHVMVDETITPDDPPVTELRSLGETLATCEDDVGFAQVHEALAHIAWISSDFDDAMAHMQKGLAASYRGKARTPLSRMSVSFLSMLVAGPMAVDDALRRCEAIGPVAQRSALVEISLKTSAAHLLALAGALGVARRSLEDAEAIQSALGQPPWVARVPRVAGSIESMDGDPAAAILRAGAGLDDLLAMGHPAGVDSGLIVARALCDLERFDEAVELARRLSESLASNPTSEAPEVGEGEIAGVLARALAATGKRDEAGSALARSDGSPPSSIRLAQAADRLVDTARACIALERPDDARSRIEKAIELYQAKGASLPETLARTLL
ncbi:MAG: hypothetical protein ABR579_09570, partial [Actinomycetota bacterium]